MKKIVLSLIILIVSVSSITPEDIMEKIHTIQKKEYSGAIIVPLYFPEYIFVAFPFAEMSGHKILFTSETTLPSLIRELETYRYRSVILFGKINADEKKILEDYATEIIDMGSLEEDTLIILKKIKNITDTRQIYFLTPGIVEKSYYQPFFPAVIIREKLFSSELMDYISKNYDVAVCIGPACMENKSFKRLHNAGLRVFYKLGTINTLSPHEIYFDGSRIIKKLNKPEIAVEESSGVSRYLVIRNFGEEDLFLRVSISFLSATGYFLTTGIPLFRLKHGSIRYIPLESIIPTENIYITINWGREKKNLQYFIAERYTTDKDLYSKRIDNYIEV